jgi:hypothetical protein
MTIVIKMRLMANYCGDDYAAMELAIFIPLNLGLKMQLLSSNKAL